MKYKCKECGHVFEGNLSTDVCPECGSDEIVQYNGGGLQKKLMIVFAIIAAIILIILMLKCCIIVGGEKDYSITITDDSASVYVEAFCTNYTLDLKELRDSCQVVVYDTAESQQFAPRLFANSSKIIYDINEFEPGVTYRIVLCKRKGGKELCSGTYARPVPPVAPMIKPSKFEETDPKDKCRKLGTYTVKISVDSGRADKFYINDVEYDTCNISGIKPGPRGDNYYVIIRAYDAENNLWSDSVHYKLPPISQVTQQGLSENKIKNIFRQIESRKIDAGEAKSRLVGERSFHVNVTNQQIKKELGSNPSLLKVLNYLRRYKTYVEPKVKYETTECSKRIKSIEI